MSLLTKEVSTFIEVARWRSVRKAAERLNISASALSRQLRLLEEDLGVSLLTRYSNGVETTEAGEQLLAGIHRMLELENGLRGKLGSKADSKLLRLRVGLAESYNIALTRRLRAYFAKAGQDVRLDVEVGGTDHLVARLIQGHLDAIVAFNLQTDERLRVVNVFELQVGLVYPRGLIDEPPSAIALTDCLSWPLCLPSEDLSIHARLLSEINRQGRPYQIATTSNSIATTCSLIRGGAGVGFMTLADVLAQPAPQELDFIPLKDRRLTEHVSFAVAPNIDFRSDLGAALLPIGKIAADISIGAPA